MENKEGIKKINIDDNMRLNSFRNLPPEALALLGNIVDKQEIKTNTPKEEVKKEEVKITEPKENLNIEIKQNIKEEVNINEKININIKIPPPPPPPPPSANMNTVPPPPKVARKEDIIIDENGNLFGLSLGKSNKTDVLNTMKDRSKENITTKNNVFKYEDIGISFYFSASGILEEISFYYPFKGKTNKGLCLNDDINKAVKLYGEPKMRTLEGAIWPKISLFLQDDIVTSIRIRK